MRQVTQKDIAKKVGVSRQAVAFALSDSPDYHKNLRPETRSNILEVAKKMGYVPHRYAQLMRAKKSGVIGMIKTAAAIQTSVERSFHASRAIYDAGYALLANELLWSEKALKRAVTEMLSARVEGVLLNGVWEESAMTDLQPLHNANIPMVSLAGARQPLIPYVVANFRQGMFDLTKHLLELGYRKLTFVSAMSAANENTVESLVYQERLKGFRDATARAGLSESEARVIWKPMDSSTLNGYEPGRSAVREVFESGDQPEALLCNNDYYAIGAIGLCAETGLRVPEDLAITGFDNTTIGSYIFPTLTTVAHPSEMLAKKAVELLLLQIRGETISASKEFIQLPCQLVVRQSSGSRLRKATKA